MHDSMNINRPENNLQSAVCIEDGNIYMNKKEESNKPNQETSSPFFENAPNQKLTTGNDQLNQNF